MKNIIYIGRDEHSYYHSTKRIDIKNVIHDGNTPILGGTIRSFLDIDLERGEVAQLIYDTETQTITVKRERKKAWYLVKASSIMAMWWDGENFKDGSGKQNGVYAESLFIEIDETPLNSPFLKELE